MEKQLRLCDRLRDVTNKRSDRAEPTKEVVGWIAKKQKEIFQGSLALFGNTNYTRDFKWIFHNPCSTKVTQPSV